MEIDSILNFDRYCEIVETLAEVACLMVGGTFLLNWERHEEDYLNEIDRFIQVSRLLVHESAFVLALSPNWDAFHEEYTLEEIEALIEEMGGKGDLTSMMAYYALQADVVCSVKVMINNLDTEPVIG